MINKILIKMVQIGPKMMGRALHILLWTKIIVVAGLVWGEEGGKSQQRA